MTSTQDPAAGSAAMLLNVNDFLGLKDIDILLITVPDHIPAWGGKQLYIKQLSRGQQDKFIERRFGNMKVRQDKSQSQEISQAQIYGHDAWLCVKSICNAEGVLIFKESHIQQLNEKNGEAIGWIATQVVEFSGMADDLAEDTASWNKKVSALLKDNPNLTGAEILKLAGPEPTQEEKAADELKNS